MLILKQIRSDISHDSSKNDKNDKSRLSWLDTEMSSCWCRLRSEKQLKTDLNLFIFISVENEITSWFHWNSLSILHCLLSHFLVLFARTSRSGNVGFELTESFVANPLNSHSTNDYVSCKIGWWQNAEQNVHLSTLIIISVSRWL